MHLAPGVVEVIGAYVGFSSNGLIIIAASQSLLKNLYQYWWQWQYLAMEWSLDSMLSRQFGCGTHQLNLQQRPTPHGLSPHPRGLSSSI